MRLAFTWKSVVDSAVVMEHALHRITASPKMSLLWQLSATTPATKTVATKIDVYAKPEMNPNSSCVKPGIATEIM